jgi:DNA-binding PadR family transcriptional regulator
LYPALHRLDKKGWLAAQWETPKDRNREFKYYRLTPAGRKQLVEQEAKWAKLADAIGRVLARPEEKTS